MEQLESAKKSIEDLKLTKNDTVIVAVSGGPDSMALLHLLIENKSINNFKIVCAHVHHNVRKESDDELIFVSDYCKDNNIIFESMKIEKEIKKNFESEARNIRYDFFKSLIKKYNAKYLFTAHHGDDLIETILMRIVRGSNINGYAGFKAITKFDNYILVKPLITITKKDIINYNLDHNIKWVEDKTNKEDIHTRNRYRNYIVPKLKEENPNVHLKFLKYSENLLECSDYVEKIIDQLIDKIFVDKKIILSKFNEQDNFIKKNILYRILKNIYGNDLNNINDKHIKSILDLSLKEGYGLINLPKGITVVKNYNYIYFRKIVESEKEYFYFFEKKEQQLPNKHVIARENEVKDNSNYTCLLDSSEICLPLVIRTKKDGDTMIVKNLNKEKKISDIFINEKIDKDAREDWPLVTDDKNNIVWIPGIKKSKYCKQKDEKYDIILRYY